MSNSATRLQAPRAGWSAPATLTVALAAGTAAVTARAAGLASVAWAAFAAAILVAAAAPQWVAFTLIVTVVIQDWLVAAGFPAAQRADEALIAAGLLGLGLRGLAVGRLLRTPLDAPVLALVAAAGISAIARDVPATVAVLGLLAVLKGPLAFELFARSPATVRGSSLAARAIVVLVAGLALLAVAQRLGGESVYTVSGRLEYYLQWQGGKAPSLFTNHNALGHACVLGGALAVGLAYSGPRRSRRFYVAAGTVCLAGLIVSASRESWLAAAFALAIGAWVMRSRRLLVVALGVTAALAIGAIAVYFASPLLRAEIARRLGGVGEGWRLYRMGFNDWAYRGEYRVYVLLKSWEVFRDNVWLGAGPGRFGGQVAMVTSSPVYERYAFLPLRGEYHPLDVFWSRLLGEFGLLGSFAYLWAWLAAGVSLRRATAAACSVTRGLALGGVMAWAAAAVIAFFAPALEDPLVALPVFGWSGAVWALHRRSARSGSATAPAIVSMDDSGHSGSRPPSGAT